jgi:hypothetical protein
MPKKVIVGHGGFSPDGKWVLVPNNTSVTFYSDAGSTLGMPFKATGPIGAGWVEGVNCDFDFDKVKAVLDQGFKSQNVVLNGGVVENFSVQPLGAGSSAIAKKVDWWGETAEVPESGEDLKLCTDPDNCPGPKLRDEMQKYLDTNGAEGRLVAEEEYDHKCKGLLNKWAGYEIHWISCTGFTGDMSALQGAVPSQDSAMGQVAMSSWTPNDADLDKVVQKNETNVKAMDDKSSVDLEVGGVLVLVGSGHEDDPVAYVKRQGDHEKGTLTVKRSPFGAGTVVVKGISPKKRELITMSIEKFSDKSVKFE